jgi:hypothetical protein
MGDVIERGAQYSPALGRKTQKPCLELQCSNHRKKEQERDVHSQGRDEDGSTHRNTAGQRLKKTDTIAPTTNPKPNATIDYPKKTREGGYTRIVQARSPSVKLMTATPHLQMYMCVLISILESIHFLIPSLSFPH